MREKLLGPRPAQNGPAYIGQLGRASSDLGPAKFVKDEWGPLARDVDVVPGYRASHVMRLNVHGQAPNVDLVVKFEGVA